MRLDLLPLALQRLSQPTTLLKRARALALGRIVGAGLPTQRGANVAMFHLGRSGSTVLADMVGQQDGVFWDGEIYEWALRRWEKRAGRMARREDHCLDPLSELRRRMTRVRTPIYGFEVKFFHLELGNLRLADYVRALPALGVSHFVLLRRRNLLRVIVSAAIADRSQRYHNARRQRPRLDPIHLDPQAIAINRSQQPLLQFLREYEAQLAELSGFLTERPVLELSYEEDVAEQPERGYRKLCELVGLPPRPAFVAYSRTTPFPLAQVVSNFGELERELAGTEFAWMLHEES